MGELRLSTKPFDLEPGGGATMFGPFFTFIA